MDSTKPTKSKNPSPKKVLCYVCNTPMKSHRMIYVGRDDNGKKIRRHDSCCPGSDIWMRSNPGHKSKNRQFFERSKPQITVEKVEKVLPSIKNNSEGQKLLELFNKTTDKAERKKLRRKLRKLNIYISNLKNPEKAKQRSSLKKPNKIKSNKKDL